MMEEGEVPFVAFVVWRTEDDEEFEEFKEFITEALVGWNVRVAEGSSDVGGMWMNSSNITMITPNWHQVRRSLVLNKRDALPTTAVFVDDDGYQCLCRRSHGLDLPTVHDRNEDDFFIASGSLRAKYYERIPHRKERFVSSRRDALKDAFRLWMSSVIVVMQPDARRVLSIALALLWAIKNGYLLLFLLLWIKTETAIN